MKKILLVGLFAAGAGLLTAHAAPKATLITLAQVGQEVGKPVDLKFTDIDGKPQDIANLKGKVVLIDFWATWCPPCRGEVPSVVEAYQKYHAQGFEILGISLDQDKDALTAFTKQNGMTWPQYFDGKGWDNEISKGFGIDSIPAMWLVDQKGNLVTVDGREDLAGQVEKLLKGW